MVYIYILSQKYIWETNEGPWKLHFLAASSNEKKNAHQDLSEGTLILNV